jgi:hypothetical protein
LNFNKMNFDNNKGQIIDDKKDKGNVIEKNKSK